MENNENNNDIYNKDNLYRFYDYTPQLELEVNRLYKNHATKKVDRYVRMISDYEKKYSDGKIPDNVAEYCGKLRWLYKSGIAELIYKDGGLVDILNNLEIKEPKINKGQIMEQRFERNIEKLKKMIETLPEEELRKIEQEAKEYSTENEDMLYKDGKVYKLKTKDIEKYPNYDKIKDSFKGKDGYYLAMPIDSKNLYRPTSSWGGEFIVQAPFETEYGELRLTPEQWNYVIDERVSKW